MGATAVLASAPTQVRRPWRAALRTALQAGIPTVLALGVVVPQIVEAILGELGESAPSWLTAALLGVSAAVTVTAAIASRIMAIAGVEAFLRRHKLISGLAAEPGPNLSAGVTGPHHYRPRNDNLDA